MISEHRALRQLQFQVSKTNFVKYGAKISTVLRAFLREDDHIVQLRETDTTNQSLQHSGYQPLIRRRRITENKSIFCISKRPTCVVKAVVSTFDGLTGT